MRMMFGVIVLLLSSNLYAQSPIAVNIDSFVMGSRIATTSQSGQWERIIADNAYYAYTFNIQNYGSGERALPEEYYRKRYDYYPSAGGQQQVTQSHPTINFFQNRIYNSYYRDLEEWRKSERSKLKREGRYDRAAIEYIHGIRPNY